MSSGWTQRPPARQFHSGWRWRRSRDSNPYHAFCRRGAHPERSLRRCVPPAGFEPAASASGEPRASAALRGQVCAGGGIRTPYACCSRVTAGPDSPTSARPLGVATGIRTLAFRNHNPACTSRTPQPPCSRQDSNLQPPVCRTGALPIELHEPRRVPAAGLEPAPGRLIRALPSPFGRRGHDAATAGFEPATGVVPVRRFQRRLRNQPVPPWLWRQDSNLHLDGLTIRCPTCWATPERAARTGLEPATCPG
jgi:hypothetical protein